MPFVKLDCGTLDSSLWIDRDARDIFITALLMAVPFELDQPTAQIEIGSLRETGFMAPPGWYGFVHAAAPGIVGRSLMPDKSVGLDALKRLGDPDPLSRSQEYEGRRLIRVNGGFLVLNYAKYRDRDYTAADRARRYRERKKTVTRDSVYITPNVTQAEAEAYADKNKNRFADFWSVYPKKVSRAQAERTWKKKGCDSFADRLIQDVTFRVENDAAWKDKTFIPHASTYITQERWNDEIQKSSPAKPSYTTRTDSAVIMAACKKAGIDTVGKSRVELLAKLNAGDM